eukprot:7030339-Lingulodinium_polyedra.AAC.1
MGCTAGCATIRNNLQRLRLWQRLRDGARLQTDVLIGTQAYRQRQRGNVRGPLRRNVRNANAGRNGVSNGRRKRNGRLRTQRGHLRCNGGRTE